MLIVSEPHLFANMNATLFSGREVAGCVFWLLGVGCFLVSGRLVGKELAGKELAGNASSRVGVGKSGTSYSVHALIVLDGLPRSLFPVELFQRTKGLVGQVFSEPSK
jgi:hypothetical protein